MARIKFYVFLILSVFGFTNNILAANTVLNLESVFPIHGSYVVFDLETTGLSPSRDDIIEIGALKVDERGQIIDSYSKLVRPSKEISTNVTDLTGISNDMVRNAEPIDNVLPEFLDFVGDKTVVGHNVKFDIAFIQNKSKMILNRNFYNEYVDTLMIAKNMYPGLKSYKLQALRQRFGIETDAAHRALEDCIVTQKLYTVLCKNYVEVKEQ